MSKTPFEDEQRALSAYLREPELEREAFKESIVPKLIKRAYAALDHNSPPEAFRLFNRVLAYDPQRAEVHRALKRMQRRHRSSRAALLVAAAAMVVVAAYGFHRRFPDAFSAEVEARDIRTDRPLSATRGEPPVGVQALMGASASATQLAVESGQRARAVSESRALALRQSGELASARARQLAALARALSVERARRKDDALWARSRLASRGAGAPTQRGSSGPSGAADMGGLEVDAAKAAPPSHLYKFHLRPASAVLSIDGNDYEAARANQGIELEEGQRYTVRANCARGCQPFSTTLYVGGPPAQESPKTITLVWRNGIVKITTPRDSLLYLPGKRARVVELAAGEEYRYKVDFGDAGSAPTPSKELTFVVRDRNQMQNIYERTVTIEPGATRAIDATF